ncbi:MAG: DNA repair protein RadA [Verrucomicrobia bacterium]|nr:DNA repair protein RadA [Verrucomicrobiota bacterium]
MKLKSVWYCSSCGSKQARWLGQCPACSEWNTLQEEVESNAKKAALPAVARAKQAQPVRLAEIAIGATSRSLTGIGELDRCLGGGLVSGSLTLIGGEPGIGKSTLSLQVAAHYAKAHTLVLYVCGEESLEQTSLRAKRLGISSEHILFFNETDLDLILRQIDQLQPKLVIIDSIQIIYKPEISSAPGTVSQVRECTSNIMQVAKTLDISIMLVGHVTKSGDIAGPKVLEHLVDTVLYFEGDRQQQFRLLRVFKNRFGPTDEIAVFQMSPKGLVEIVNPSQMFLEERMRGASGSVIIPTVEGSRPILIEVQALVTDTFFPTASRRSTGIDTNRLALLLAVLEKRAKFQLHGSDIFVSITGGIKASEPAADLGILLAIASSFSNRSLHPDTLVIGEVGLGGEVRAVGGIENRIKEGIQMGFSRCIVPKRNLKGLTGLPSQKIELHAVSWIDEAIDELMR